MFFIFSSSASIGWVWLMWVISLLNIARSVYIYSKFGWKINLSNFLNLIDFIFFLLSILLFLGESWALINYYFLLPKKYLY